MSTEQRLHIDATALTQFAAAVLEAKGVASADAAITADVLVQADLRGIVSHGVARLRRYVDGLDSGLMKAKPDTTVVNETPATALIDADGGLGQPASHLAMSMAIEKAEKLGAGFVTVRNSNHYGFAGYYPLMALQRGCVGISMTNSAVLVVPTFARNALLGTNPIAVAAPGGSEPPFVLDMATSTVPRGKLEVYNRQEQSIPMGWATDAAGEPTDDAGKVLRNFQQLAGGGLLPMGGAGELLGGHKGYGLAVLVEVLSAVLSGAAHADQVYPKDADGKPLPANLGHFFGALKIDAFRPQAEFEASMDDLQQRLKGADRVEGQDRIWVAGEKEHDSHAQQSVHGITVGAKVSADLLALSKEYGVAIDGTLDDSTDT